MQRSVRGATTIEKDSKEKVVSATKELLQQILDENSVDAKDIVNIIFTATTDITSEFPAVAAREIGLQDVPLIDCQQMMCHGALKLCIRVMLTYNTKKRQQDIRHVYLYNAQLLRPDLVENEKV